MLLGRKVRNVMLVLWHQEALSHLCWGRHGRVQLFLLWPDDGFAGSHVSMVDVSLQVPLRKVGPFAALDNTAHEQ